MRIKPDDDDDGDGDGDGDGDDGDEDDGDRKSCEGALEAAVFVPTKENFSYGG